MSLLDHIQQSTLNEKVRLRLHLIEQRSLAMLAVVVFFISIFDSIYLTVVEQECYH